MTPPAAPDSDPAWPTPPPPSAWRTPAALLLAILGSVIAAGLLFSPHLLSVSGDLAHHGLMVDALLVHHQTLPRAELGYFPYGFTDYPNLGHRIAALLAAAGLAIPRALNLVGMASAVLVWTLLFDLLRQGSKVALAVSLFVLATASHDVYAILGGEVVGNFFFAQLAGEAGFVAAIVLLAPLGTRPVVFAVAAAAAVYVCSNLHLIAAIKVAGAILALWGADVIASRKTPGLRPVRFLTPLAVLATLTLSPQIRLMHAIAQNDGGIGFGVAISPGATALMAAILLTAAVAGLLLGRVRRSPEPAREGGVSRTASDLLCAIAIGSAAPALGQYLMLRLFHDGSPYAVEKWAFGVVSMLIVTVPLLLSQLLPRRLRGDEPPSPRAAWLWPVAAFGAALVLTGVLYARPPATDLDILDATTRDVTRLRESLHPKGLAAGFASSTLPTGLAFYENTVGLHDPQVGPVIEVFERGVPRDFAAFHDVLTLQGDPKVDLVSCRTGRGSGAVVVLSGACLAAAAPSAGLSPTSPIAFRTGAPGTAYLRDGWSDPEPDHVWSRAREAEVVIPLSRLWRPAGPQRLTVSTYGFIAPPQSPERHVTLRVDGATPLNTTYAPNAREHAFTVVLDGAALARAGEVRLHFSIADPASPSSVGLGSDTRLLGVALTSVAIAPR